MTHDAELTLELSAKALCQRYTFHGPGVARCMGLCVTRVGGGYECDSGAKALHRRLGFSAKLPLLGAMENVDKFGQSVPSAV